MLVDKYHTEKENKILIISNIMRLLDSIISVINVSRLVLIMSKLIAEHILM